MTKLSHREILDIILTPKDSNKTILQNTIVFTQGKPQISIQADGETANVRSLTDIISEIKAKSGDDFGTEDNKILQNLIEHSIASSSISPDFKLCPFGGAFIFMPPERPSIRVKISRRNKWPLGLYFQRHDLGELSNQDIKRALAKFLDQSNGAKICNFVY